MKIENADILSYVPGSLYALPREKNAPAADVKLSDGTDTLNLKYGKENFSGVNLSTRIYADKVIKTALKNIESGENIAENKRIIQIFGPLVHEDPQKIIYG